MEQTNLVVTPDGKSWDEVTRDVGYMGAEIHRVSTDTAQSSSSTDNHIFDEHRGTFGGKNSGWKNFVSAYDRQICLRDGHYTISAYTIKTMSQNYHCRIYVNAVIVVQGHSGSVDHDTIFAQVTVSLKRGDYIQVNGGWQGHSLFSGFSIMRVGD
jgi:hypothetical protein